MPVQAVVFDAMGTIIEPSPSVAHVYQAALKKHCQLDLSTDEIHAALKTALRERSSGKDLSTSEDAEAAFWDRFIEGLAGDASGRTSCFDKLFRHFGDAANWTCFSDVPDTIAELSRYGLILGIASNFDQRLHAVLDGTPALCSIPHRIVSSDVGWRKPAPRFFEAVFQQIGVPAEKVLMVGDDLVNDVKGALDAGCQAAWICRSATDVTVPSGTIVLSKLTDLPACISFGS